jgi:hypothetical protein
MGTNTRDDEPSDRQTGVSARAEYDEEVRQ